MKRLTLIILLFYGGLTTALAQRDAYVTSSGELIFSWADVDNNGRTGGVVTRFSAFLHLQSLVNFDMSPSVGFFTGLAIRNVGFIYDDPDSTELRTKFRNYTIGVPVGVKLGNLDRRFVYLGYELEIPISYKEKTFVNGNRENTFTTGFTSRTPDVYHTVFLGFNALSGISVKFKYYLTEFFNRSYTETINGVSVQPYRDLRANLFYVSLNFDLFTGTEFTYNGN